VVERISRSHLQRILQAAEVRPHRVRQWLHSPDPQFREKVNQICALYRQAPKGSVVLSIDEKTGIQAIERKHADRAPRPAQARRQEFEYIRHGTQALTAALDVHSGRVLGFCRNKGVVASESRCSASGSESEAVELVGRGHDLAIGAGHLPLLDHVHVYGRLPAGKCNFSAG
jgi:hypothetical protein